MHQLTVYTFINNDIAVSKNSKTVRGVLEKATRIFNGADFKIRIIYNFEITLRNISNRFEIYSVHIY